MTTSNADKLRHIKQLHGLTSRDVADLLHVSIHTVNSWLINQGDVTYRAMPDSRIEHLKLILKEQNNQ